MMGSKILMLIVLLESLTPITLLREIRETYKKINLITVQMPGVPSGICR